MREDIECLENYGDVDYDVVSPVSPEDFDPASTHSFSDYSAPGAPWVTVPCLLLS